MDYCLFSSLFVYMFFMIDMSPRCLMLSGYWEVDPAYHWSNTTGGIVYTLIGSKLSKIGCAAVCLHNSDCLMFGYSDVTGTCRGFRYLEHNPVSVLEKSEVIYKNTQCCHLAGYKWKEDGPLCVKMYNISMTWNNAKAHCEQDHGRLAIFDNAKKYQAYFYGGNAYKYSAWLGVSDQEREGSWVWINGADLDTSYWSSVELNDYSGAYLPDRFTADCGIVGVDGKLFDNHCLQISPFLCQRLDLE